MVINQNQKSSKTTASNQSTPNEVVAAYVLGGISFIPLIGVLFGVAAIIIGAIKKTKGPIILGCCGILVTIILYGSLFYFGFVAKTGPFADLKKQLTSQIINDTKTRVLAYKATHNNALPNSLQDLGQPTQQNPVFTFDAWNNQLVYVVNPDGSFTITSNGPDGIPNTADDISVTQQ